MSQPALEALISKSELVLRETDGQKVASWRDTIFSAPEQKWVAHGHPEGSPWQVWYRKASKAICASTNPTDTNAQLGLVIHDYHDPRTRNIVIKDKAEFNATNIFFRTVDTGRLLPMEAADFRIQWYANQNHWDLVDNKNAVEKGAVASWETCSAVLMIQQLVVLRNMHDQGGADIPVLVVNWSDHTVGLAMDYWVNLSKGAWTSNHEGRDSEFQHVSDHVKQDGLPCFYQADLLVRALLHDQEVGYVPPFIVINQGHKNGKFRILFTSPLSTPPHSLLASFPAGCNSVSCDNPDCYSFLFHLPASNPLLAHSYATLAPNTSMVRSRYKTQGWLGRRIVCNLWGCERGYLLGEGSDGMGDISQAKWTKGERGREWRVIGGGNVPIGADSTKLLRCQKCKEVAYCCKEHQGLDWQSHKKICEKR